MFNIRTCQIATITVEHKNGFLVIAWERTSFECTEKRNIVTARNKKKYKKSNTQQLDLFLFFWLFLLVEFHSFGFCRRRPGRGRAFNRQQQVSLRHRRNGLAVSCCANWMLSNRFLFIFFIFYFFLLIGYSVFRISACRCRRSRHHCSD